MVTIDYTSTERRPRKVNGKACQVRYVLAVCDCGERWYVRQDTAHKVKACYRCSQRAKGKRGYAVTAEKYGVYAAAGYAREYRLNHPSRPELAVMAILDEWSIQYEREYMIAGLRGEPYYIDFLLYLPAGVLAVEVQGYWHHTAAQAERDTRKREALDYACIPLLTIDEDEVYSGAARRKLGERVNVAPAA